MSNHRLDTETRAKRIQDVCKWLSPLRFPARQKELFGNVQRSTGQWFLKSKGFNSWLDSEAETLLCHGGPGKGKTMLAAIVHDHLQHCFPGKQYPVLCMYLNHKEQKEQTMSNLIGSLLKQVVQYQDDLDLPLSKAVESLYKDTKQKELDPTIDHYFKALKSEVDGFERVFIIVDALDESLPAVRTQLINKLEDLYPEKVRLMFTSRLDYKVFAGSSFICDGADCDQKLTLLRVAYHCDTCPDFDLCEECHSAPANTHSKEHFLKRRYRSINIGVSARGKDLEKYIDGMINENEDLHFMCQRDEKLREEIRFKLTSGADGMFLLPKLHMETLQCMRTTRDVREALRTLPTELDDTYRDIIKTRILTQKDHDKKLAKKILTWMTLAYRLLNVKELQHALAIRPGDKYISEYDLEKEEALISVTAGLITVKPGGGEVRLVHYTAQDFLERCMEEWIQDGSVELALASLTYLKFDQLSTPCVENEDFESRVVMYPFIQYAVQYWGYHVQDAWLSAAAVTETMRREAVQLLCDITRLDAFSEASWYLDETEAGWDSRKGANGLHVAAWFGMKNLLEKLLASGLDIDSQEETHGQTALILACKRGHIKTVDQLLLHGAEPNILSNRQSSALLEAVMASEVEVVARLLQVTTVDVNHKMPLHRNYTALMYAAECDDAEIAKLLLSRNDILVNEVDEGGYSALHLCAEYAYTNSISEVAELLLKQKDINLQTKSNTGNFALITAASRGNVFLVEALLQNNADSTLEDRVGGTALLRAIDYGRLNVVKTLLAHNPDLTHVDKFGRGYLHGAAVNGQAVICGLLMDAGVKPDLRSTDRGSTPLHDAARCGFLDTVKVLLEHGADPSVKDYIGQTPLELARRHEKTDVVRHIREWEMSNEAYVARGVKRAATFEDLSIWAAAEANKKDVVEAIIAAHGNLDERDPSNGDSALHKCAWFGHIDILRVLLEAGAPPDSVNQWSRTALHFAVLRNDCPAVRLLCKNHAETNMIDQWAETPLSIAILQRCYDLVECLLEHGAQIDNNRRNWIQWAFLEASYAGNVQVVEMLLVEGADPLERTGGTTAIQLARSQGHEDIVRSLTKRIRPKSKSAFQSARSRSTSTSRTELSPQSSLGEVFESDTNSP